MARRFALDVMFKEMNTTWFKAHRIFVVALLITMAHFILTSIISHYISVQIGAQMGQVVADFIIEAYERSPQNNAQKSEEDAKKLYQDMKNKRDHILENWEIPSFLISLPIKPLIKPILKDIGDARFKMVLSKEISKEQFYKRGFMIDYAVKFVNSFSLGLLVYIILRIVKHYRMKT